MDLEGIGIGSRLWYTRRGATRTPPRVNLLDICLLPVVYHPRRQEPPRLHRPYLSLASRTLEPAQRSPARGLEVVRHHTYDGICPRYRLPCTHPPAALAVR